MFSALSKYTPQQLLASYLSQSLAEYFQVDPDKVETNLINNAKVVLRDIQIRPSTIGERLVVGGSVELIEFTWAWDTQAIIANATLTIQGVSIQVKLAKEGVTDSSNQVTSDSKEDATNTTTGNDWKAKYLQQIIDHLTLVIKDVSIEIQLQDDDQERRTVSCQAQDICFKTLLQEDTGSTTPMLLQTMSMASFSAWTGIGDEKHVILDPFGYQTTIQRVSGRRFVDGVLSGLIIQGTPQESSSTIRVHAGKAQIAGLARLQEVLLSMGGVEQASLAPDDDGQISDIALQLAQDIHSVFDLPLDSMEVVLEDAPTPTTLKCAGCAIRYCTDGSELSVSCTKGIWLDSTPISRDNQWVLDLVSSKITLDALPSQTKNSTDHQGDQFYDAPTCEVSEDETKEDSDDFRLHVSLDMLERFYRGVQSILPQCQEALEVAEQAFESSTSQGNSQLWTLETKGLVNFRFSGENDLWVECALDSPRLAQALDKQGQPTARLDCRSICIQSEVGRGFTIDIPEIQTTEDDVALVQDKILAKFGSMDVATKLQELWGQVTRVIGDTSSDSVDVGMNVRIPGVDVELSSGAACRMSLVDIESVGTTWSVGSVQVQGPNDMSLEVSGLSATLSTNQCLLKIREVSNACLGKAMGCLAKPVESVEIHMDRNQATVSASTIHFQPPDLASMQGTGGSQSTAFSLPLQVKVHVKRLMIMPEFGAGKPGLCFDELHLQHSPVSDSHCHVWAKCNYFQGRDPNQSVVVAKQISAEAKLRLDSIKCEEAKLSIQELPSLEVPNMLKLAGPMTKVEVQYRDTHGVTFECDSMDLATTYSTNAKAVETTGETEATQPAKRLTLPLRCTVHRLKLVEDSTQTAALFSGLQLEVAPPTREAQTTVKLTSNDVSFKSGLSKGLLSGLKVSTRWAESLESPPSSVVTIPSLGSLVFASVDFAACLNVNVDGVGHLVEPLSNGGLRFDGNTVSINLGKVHLGACDRPRESQEIGLEEPQSNPTPNFIDIPVVLRIQTLQVEATLGSSVYLAKLINLQAACQQAEGSSVLVAQIQSEVVEAGGAEGSRLLAKDFLVDVKLLSSSTAEATSSNQAHTLPGVGCIEEATLSIGNILELQASSMGRLANPTARPVKVRLEHDKISVALPELSIEVFEKQLLECEVPAVEKGDFQQWVPSIPLAVEMLSVTTSPTGGFPGLKAEQVCLDILPSCDTDKVLVQVRCDSIGTDGNSDGEHVVSKGVNADFCLDASKTSSECDDDVIVPSIGKLVQAEVSFKSVSELKIPTIGSLVQELSTAKFLFEQNRLVVRLGAVHWKMSEMRESTAGGFGGSTQSRTWPAIPLAVDVFSIRLDRADGEFALCGKTAMAVERDPFDTQSTRATVNCQSIHGKGPGVSNLTATGISLTTLFSPMDTIGACIAFSIPGIGFLSNAELKVEEVTEAATLACATRAPLKELSLRFDRDSGVYVQCPEVAVERPMLQDTKKQGENKLNLVLPCNLSITIERASCHDISETGVCTKREIKNMSLTFEPLLAKIAGAEEGPGAAFYLKCEGFEMIDPQALLQIPLVNASGVLQLSHIDRIGNLAVGIDSAVLSSDFTSSYWSAPPTEPTTETLYLPFAAVQKLDMTLHYNGKIIVLNDATLSCKAFEGKRGTTSESLKAHYVKIVKARLPYLLSKTELAGANVGDSVGMVAGRTLLNHSLIGTTAGVIGRDAIGGALTKGKESRGAASTDGYKFGDFSRGIVASVKAATSEGSKMRGGDNYAVGDFAAGSASGTGQYVSNNRVRLSGAGGSAIGMVAGAALAGPIGLVAGSFLGASAGQSSMRAVAGDPKADAARLENTSSGQSGPQGIGANGPARQPLETQNLDLLSGSSFATSPNHAHPPPLTEVEPLQNTAAEADWIGDVATSDHRAVMVRAQVLPHHGNLSVSNPSQSLLDGSAIQPGMQHTPVQASMTTSDRSMGLPTATAVAAPAPIPQRPLQVGPNSGMYPPTATAHWDASLANDPLQTGATTTPVASHTYAAPAGQVNGTQYAGYTNPASQQQQTQYNSHRAPQQVYASNEPRGAFVANNVAAAPHHQQTAPPRANNVAAAPRQQTAPPQAAFAASAAPPGQSVARGQAASQPSQGYRFGDVTRRVVARGKEADGRSRDSGYKFGDFTRGLFKK